MKFNKIIMLNLDWELNNIKKQIKKSIIFNMTLILHFHYTISQVII